MYDPAIIWAPAMEKLTAQNGKICIICDGYCYGKDANLAGGGSSFRCLRPASRGRMKTSGNDEVFSSTKHNHAPEPEVVVQTDPDTAKDFSWNSPSFKNSSCGETRCLEAFRFEGRYQCACAHNKRQA